jgi:hypothetical protein
MKKCQGLFAIVVLLLCCLSLSISYAVAQEICEQHPFLNSTDGFSQNFFYSYGRGWHFTAINNLTISSVQAHSSLAGPNGSTAHIQVKINDETIASWDQILTTTYTYYTHDALVNADLRTGDAITFFIYGGTSSTAGGAVRNADNYVKLCGTLWVAPPPTVNTLPAKSITSRSANLRGTLDPRGTPAKYYFDYGIKKSYEFSTPQVSIGPGESLIEVTQNVKGLSSSTTYHFRLVGVNDSGTSYGSDQEFTTRSHDSLTSIYHLLLLDD